MVPCYKTYNCLFIRRKREDENSRKTHKQVDLWFIGYFYHRDLQQNFQLQMFYNKLFITEERPLLVES